MNGNDKCAHCGGDSAIHHYQTAQCPVGGREAPMGKLQEWRATTFSVIVDPPNRLARDMTIREHFAGLAMQGFIAQQSDMYGFEDDGALAKASVSVADLLVDALNASK